MKLSSLILLLVIILSCNSNTKKEFEFAGGTIQMCLENDPFTFIPFEAEDYNSAEIMRQIMEGLVSFDPKSIEITPQIASEWKVSENGLTYSFTLREDILFHAHDELSSKDDRTLKASDVVATFHKICAKNSEGKATSGYNFIFKETLKGADNYFQGKAKTISGIKAKGNVVTLTLLAKDDNFLSKLASVQASIMPKKLLDKDLLTDMIGTGPFMFNGQTKEEQTKISLVKNPEYYEVSENGCALPYLDGIDFIIENRKLEQLDMFENKEIDLILGLPTSRITKMLEGRIGDFNSSPPKLLLIKNPILVSNYYFFNMKDPRFQDPRVRQAFNYAINKTKLGREILRDQYDELGIYGVVPPITKDFRGYGFEQVKNSGYSYDPEKAKKLLADAGYPNGEGFGSVTLRFNIGDVNSAVADDFSQQIFQVLGINVNIDGSTFEQLNADALMGRGDIFRTAWAADYPNPETFLNKFYGKHITADTTIISTINQAKYVNPQFDSYFEQAKQADKISEKMTLYSKAEIELLKNPPIIPLWYNGDLQIVHANVRNLHFNSLGMFDFKEVYKKEWTEEEYQKSITK